MNGTEFIAQILKQEGVNEMTCFPSNALIEEAAKQGIRPVMFRHERGAIMAADAYSRMSNGNKFGVVAMQHAAGAEKHVRPNFLAAENWKGVTKSVETIDTPSQIKDVMRRAFHALRNGNGGPVVVEMTLDICAMEVPEDALDYQSPSVSKSVPSKTDIQDAVKALLAADRPVIWAGAGVLMAQASPELAEFAELTDIPVFTTMEGKSAYDERLPLSLGAGSGATTGPAYEWINESDVVIGIGTSLSQNNYTRKVPAGKKTIIHNTINQVDINKGTPSHIGLVGDAKLTLAALIEEVKAQIGEDGRNTGAASHIANVKEKWMAEWLPILNSNEAPLNPYRVINEINKNVDHENSVVTHDAGGPRDCMVPFYTATTPNSYLGWGKTTHLGFGIPAMIGAKLADPSKFCLNYMGDGAWGMSGTDTAAAAKMGLPITTVLLNNGGMATYPGGFPTARENYDVSFMEGNYAQITEGMGGVGIEVSKPEELGPAILKARQLNAEGRTVLIDVKSNYESRKSFFGR
jgi:thiamine pyrophosphate-dependent acetolactate synthase large subunit-like protein